MITQLPFKQFAVSLFFQTGIMINSPDSHPGIIKEFILIILKAVFI